MKFSRSLTDCVNTSLDTNCVIKTLTPFGWNRILGATTIPITVDGRVVTVKHVGRTDGRDYKGALVPRRNRSPEETWRQLAVNVPRVRNHRDTVSWRPSTTMILTSTAQMLMWRFVLRPGYFKWNIHPSMSSNNAQCD